MGISNIRTISFEGLSRRKREW